MSFQYVPNQLAAVDDELGLRVEQDLTFYDETTVRLKVRDTVAGRTWSMVVRTVNASITYDSPTGPQTSRTTVEAGLPRNACDPMFEEMAQARRLLGARALEPAEAADAVLAGAKLVLTTGGALLKFVPGFHITWD